MVLEGVVTNVAAFGAFVDVGVHQDGLVHVSAMSDSFVSDPHEVVRSGQVVKVKVLEVDVDRQRIGLTLRLDDEPGDRRGGGRRGGKEAATGRGGARGGQPRDGQQKRGGRPGGGHRGGGNKAGGNKGGGNTGGGTKGGGRNSPATGSMAQALRDAGFGR